MVEDGLPDEDIDLATAQSVARSLRQLLDGAARRLNDEHVTSPLVTRVTEHLGCELRDVVVVAKSLPSWEHVNLQCGVDAYLEAHSPGAAWFGVSGANRDFEDLINMLASARQYGSYEIGSADYATAAVGPAASTEVVQLGLVTTTTPDGVPVVLGIRGSREHGPPECRLDVLAASRTAATAVRDEIERLMRVHDVFRGQVLSFGYSEHHGNELVRFLPRASLAAEEVVLPDGVLDAVEGHVIGIGERSEQLLAAGQHLKRGLLLHGPPGTGKTHTIRYLIGRLTGCTVILMTGPAMRFIEQAAALARRLQPSMVVLEDVDLVATDRSFSPDDPHPLLFSLLDAMDGVGADADVTFVLTTNRVAMLEQALADRPGRVDLAIEIPRPDASAREQLIRLYARDLELRADLTPVVAATKGVTASFVKELLRRTVLVALHAGDTPRALDDGHFKAALDEMTSERQTLTRSLLGADAQPAG